MDRLEECFELNFWITMFGIATYGKTNVAHLINGREPAKLAHNYEPIRIAF